MSMCVCSVLVLCCKLRPYDGLIPRPRSPTDCVWIKKLKRRPRSTRAVEPEIDFMKLINLSLVQGVLRSM
jgi:hypothetical protein